MTNAPVPNAKDLEQLKLLSRLHFLYGGFSLLGACGVVAASVSPMFTISEALSSNSLRGGPQPEMARMVLVFIAVVTVMVVALCFTYAICVLVAGRCLALRRRYLFCLIMAGWSCLGVPLGTALGAFTIVVLTRPPVKALFVTTPRPPLPHIK